MVHRNMKKCFFLGMIVIFAVFFANSGDHVTAQDEDGAAENMQAVDSLSEEGQLTPPEFEEILRGLRQQQEENVQIQPRLPSLYTRHLFVMGHGELDPGAVGNGTNERDFTRTQLLPYLKKYAAQLIYSKVEFYDVSKDMYQESKRGRGAFAVSKDYNSVTEVHLDGGSTFLSGGHVIVSPSANTPQNIALSNTIKKYVGLNPAYVGSGGLSYRTDLFNLRILKERGIPYRLTELGFITNSGDVNKIRANLDAIAKSMIESVTGEKVTTNFIGGNIDQITEGRDTFDVAGWFLNEQVDNGLPVIFIVDEQGRELARAIAQKVERTDVAGAYPGITHAAQSGFKATFKLTEQLQGKKVYFLGRKALDDAGNQSLFDFYFNGSRTLPMLVNDGAVQNFTEKNDQVVIAGWHISSKSGPDNYKWLQIIDVATGKVLQKKLIEGIISNSAKSKYPALDYTIAGFDESFRIEDNMKGKTIQIKALFTSDLEGNQVVSEKIFSNSLPLCDENGVYRILTYRVYNKNNGDHLYTQDRVEYDRLIYLGWKDEKIAWYSPKNGVPVYRLYNPNTGEHFYTINEMEYDAVAKAGWKKEDIAFYSDAKKQVKIYRLFNPNATGPGSHHFTQDDKEQQKLIQSGWKDEKVGFYSLN